MEVIHCMPKTIYCTGYIFQTCYGLLIRFQLIIFSGDFCEIEVDKY